MRAALAIILTPLIAAAAVAGCSLGLDHSLIGQVSDAATPFDTGGMEPEGGADSGPLEAGSDTSASEAGDGSPEAASEAGVDAASGCSQNSDCVSPNACLTGRCNTTTKECAFDLCPSTVACMGSACDGATNTCGTPAMYGFQAGAIDVGTAIGCGGSVATCVAASFPFVYVGTPQGVVAVNVSDPANATPTIVPVAGIPFYPSFILASGSRVYFVGPLQSSGSSGYMVPVAWIDPAADPTAPLTARSAFVAYPTSTLGGAFPNGTGGVYLENTGGSVTGLLTAPVPDPTTIMLATTTLGAGETIVGASLTNFVTFETDMADIPNFGVVMGAGTAMPMDEGTQTVSQFGAVSRYFTFAGAPDGSFLFNAALIDVATGKYTGVRFGWVLTGGANTNFNGQTTFLAESYTPPAGFSSSDTPILAPLAGPVAWLDSNRALVTAAATAAEGGTGSTSVQVVTQANMPPSLVNGVVLSSVPTNMVGTAGSQSPAGISFGYVVASSASGVTLNIIAPDCAP